GRPAARSSLAAARRAATCGLCGSTARANARLASVYSCPHHTRVSGGRAAMTSIKARFMSAPVPSKNLPQPARRVFSNEPRGPGSCRTNEQRVAREEMQLLWPIGVFGEEENVACRVARRREALDPQTPERQLLAVGHLARKTRHALVA